jgi:hypothetical protein
MSSSTQGAVTPVSQMEDIGHVEGTSGPTGIKIRFRKGVKFPKSKVMAKRQVEEDIALERKEHTVSDILIS